MDALLTALIVLLSSGGVILTAYYLLKRETDREKLNLQLELRKSRQEYFLPNRVEAYQRSVLYLERINLNSLIYHLNRLSNLITYS